MHVMFGWRGAMAVAVVIAVALMVGSSRPTTMAQEPVDAAPWPVPHLETMPLSAVKKPDVSGKFDSPKLTTRLALVAKLTSRGAIEHGIRGVETPNLPPWLQGAIEGDALRLSDGTVQVYIETKGSIDGVVAELSARGIAIENVSGEMGILQARVPMAQLAEIAALPAVRLVREPDYGALNAGAALTEGDAIHGAPALRGDFGVDGTGVRVGVISGGLEGIGAAQTSGDLPAAVDSTTCDVVETADATDAGAGAEGTAMLEVIHDVAPGAELWFGYWGFGVGGTSLDFMAAVDCLADHVDVIVDDVSFFNAGPYDGTSDVSQNAAAELADASNPVRGYYNAVGNYARQHYQATFADSTFDVTGGPGVAWSLHEFASSASTTDAGLGLQCSANANDGYCGDTVALMPGGTLTVQLQWDDPWGASSNDYDLLILDQVTGNLLLAGFNTQDGDDDPVESFSWENEHAVNQAVNVMVGQFSGLPRELDLFVHCTGCFVFGAQSALHNFNTEGSSVPNNSDAGGLVVSLGSIDQADAGHDSIRAYSSRGPTNGGATKPDASAIDGVSVSGAGGFPPTFAGTSAAASHAGAIAALVLSCRPSLLQGEAGDNPATDRVHLRDALLSSAVDLGDAGDDDTFGSGRLDARAAADAAGCTTDGDGDDVLNQDDNCPTVANGSQTNTDGDPIVTPGVVSPDVTRPNGDAAGDACDSDDDNDGLADDDEGSGCNGSGPIDPIAVDSDGDRVTDGAECFLGSNPGDGSVAPPTPSIALDPDRDGLVAAQESILGTDPNDVDSDDDGIHDGLEVRGHGTSPINGNSDGDACDDGAEIASVNDDTIVNSLDLQIASQHFGAMDLANLDVNKDGVISSIDLQLISQQFGDTGCVS